MNKQKPKVVKKKKKTIKRGTLVKKLDNIFSRYIRLSSVDKKGFGRCVTCGNLYHWKELQCGHFITRGNYKYRWDEDNCFSQCMRCNIFLKGNYTKYTLFMINEFGQKLIEDRINDKELCKIGTPEIKEKIEYYTELVSKMLKNTEEKPLVKD